MLERVCGSRIDRPVGSVVYTQLLDERGRIVGDVTVTRLAEDRFRIVTGAGRGRQRPRLPRAERREVEDVTDELAVIGIWGPRAREALAGITDADVSNEAFPFRTAKSCGTFLAQRITYVGELGYELYVDRALALAGLGLRSSRRRSPEPVGYQALDSLRIEKGYRYFGTDMTASDTPFDSGVGFCVAKGKHPELDRNPPTRLRTLLVGGENYLTIYGGEAVHAHGSVVGRVRSAAYGFTVRRNVALAKIPSALERGGGGAGRRARRARAGGGGARRALRPG